MRFDGQTILITGAAGALGRAVAARFDACGADLALVDVSDEALGAAFGEVDARHGTFAVDLLDGEATARTVARIEERFGRIDALAAIAGGFHMGEAVHETSDETFAMMADMNVGTLLNAARAVVPAMVTRRAGRIVTVGAAAATGGAAGMGAYIAAKGTVLRLTETMSAELKTKGINVNCVMPSIIDTPANRKAMPEADPARWVRPQDLAEVIAFLCSPGAGAVHGALIPVRGLS